MKFDSAPLGNKVNTAGKLARRVVVGAALLGAALTTPEETDAQTLRGSKASMQAQAKEAREHDYTLLKNEKQLMSMVENGYLLEIKDSEDYQLIGVAYPYARPATKLFIERFARQYRQACGERLVITSLARPLDHQPKNASKLSVHPTGMSVDIRIPRNAKCLKFLEENALSIESATTKGKKILDATREKHPPHFHIAVFPEYKDYVASKTKKK